MNALVTLERLAKPHGLHIHARSNGHVTVRGSVTVNWYPESKKSAMYIAGTIKGVEGATAKQVIDAAIGKAIPKLEPTNRKTSYTQAKIRLYRFSPCCHWCGKFLELDEMTVDHVIPLSRGGLNNPNNYVGACQPCNNARANSIPKMENVS